MAGGDGDPHVAQVMFGEQNLSGHLLEYRLREDARKHNDREDAAGSIFLFRRFERADQHQPVRHSG